MQQDDLFGLLAPRAPRIGAKYRRYARLAQATRGALVAWIADRDALPDPDDVRAEIAGQHDADRQLVRLVLAGVAP